MKISSVNLSKVTTYRFGGLCNNYIVIDNSDDLMKISHKINSKNTFVLGKGSNIAFSDKEYNGYVLKPEFEFINDTNDAGTLQVGASTYFVTKKHLKLPSLPCQVGIRNLLP